MSELSGDGLITVSAVNGRMVLGSSVLSEILMHDLGQDWKGCVTGGSRRHEACPSITECGV